MGDYDREKALAYAHRWAYARNPAYYNFDSIGGDCTNFASQVLFAGSRKMNYEKLFGWYYTDHNTRSPSWSGVNFLYKFLLNNTGSGPYGRQCPLQGLLPGDLIQLDFGAGYAHSLVVVSALAAELRVAAHTFDCDNKLLSAYTYSAARGIHIEGVRI